MEAEAEEEEEREEAEEDEAEAEEDEEAEDVEVEDPEEAEASFFISLLRFSLVKPKPLNVSSSCTSDTSWPCRIGQT